MKNKFSILCFCMICLSANAQYCTKWGPQFIKKDPMRFIVSSAEDSPSIAKPAEIYELGAYYDKQEKKICVDWSIETSAAPQLSYTVFLYNNPSCTGNALAVTSGTDPDFRTAILQTDKIRYQQTNILYFAYSKRYIQSLFSASNI